MRKTGSVALLAVAALLALLLFSGEGRDGVRPPEPGEDAPPDSPAPAAPDVPPDPLAESERAGSPEPEDPGESGILVGSVADPAGDPLPGARLWLPDRGSLPAPDGTFRVEGLPTGPMTVQAAAPGHPPAEADVEIFADREARLEFALTPGGLPIAGRVVDEVGDPIPGATVSLSPDSPGWPALRHHVVTAGDGGFRTEGLLPGRYRISASAPFRTHAYGFDAEAGRTDLLLTLHPAGELEVRIAGRERVEGVSFILRDSGGEWVNWWCEEEGELYVETGLPPGSYRVYARDIEGNTGEADFEISIGKRTRLTLDLTPGATLSGRVVGKRDRRPVAGAVIMAAENDGPAILNLLLGADVETARLNGAVWARTDEEGRYVLAGLHAGRWLLAARAPGYAPAAREGIEAPGAGPEFALDPAGSLTVTVRDDSGGAVSEAMVSVLFDAASGADLSGDTDEAGRCRFDSVPPGERGIWIQVGYVKWFAERSFRLVAGEAIDVLVQLPREEAWLEGRITRDGAPVSNLRVSVTQEISATGGTFHIVGRTNAEGRFRIGNLTPGPGELRYGNAPFGRVRRQPVLRPGANFVDVELTGLGLVLRVVDAETATTIPGFASTAGTWGRSDDRGLIRLADLPGTDVEVIVRSDGYSPARRTLTPSRDPVEVRVALTPAVRFALEVFDGEGEPVGSTTVDLVDKDGWDLADYAEEWHTSRPVTGRRIFELAPGHYALRVAAPGFRTYESKLRVPVPGDVRTVVLDRE